MKTVEQLETELESLWVDFEKLVKESSDKTDKLIAARRKIRELRERIDKK